MVSAVPLGLWTEARGGHLTGVPRLQKLGILVYLEGDGVLQTILFTRLAATLQGTGGRLSPSTQ